MSPEESQNVNESPVNDLPPEQVEALHDRDAAELTTSTPGPSISNQATPKGIRKSPRKSTPSKKKSQSFRRSCTFPHRYPN